MSLYMLLQLAAAFNIEELSLFGVTLVLVAPFVGIPINLSACKTKFTAGGKL